MNEIADSSGFPKNDYVTELIQAFTYCIQFNVVSSMQLW